MAKKPTGPQPNSVQLFDCCDGGRFLIHKAFKAQLVDGIKNLEAAKGAGLEDFLTFSVSADKKVGLMKPTLNIQRHEGKEKTFTFTLDLFIPPAK